MEIGIFAVMFQRPTLEETLDALVASGFHAVQFNLSCAGLPDMPEQIDPSEIAPIAAAAQARGITLSAVSGTFNMAHPDASVRLDGLRRLRTLAAACALLAPPARTGDTASRVYPPSHASDGDARTEPGAGHPQAAAGGRSVPQPGVNDPRPAAASASAPVGVHGAASVAVPGAPAITLCSGTRNLDSMWRPHPDNSTPQAWQDLLETMAAAARIAEAAGVTIAFEPEVSNVVDSAPKARRLLDAVASPFLKVVMDGANIYHAGELPRQRAILDEAFDLLGDDIALAHAKDLDHDGEAGHLPAGHGLLDYDHYLRLLIRSSYQGPLILHGLTVAQAPGCVAFLQQKLGALYSEK